MLSSDVGCFNESTHPLNHEELKMLLRAMNQVFASSSRRASRRRFSVRRLEALESRCLLTVSHSVVGTAVTITATKGEDLVLSTDGASLVYEVDGGDAIVIDSIDAGEITSLRVNATNSSGSNKIVLNLSAATFLSLLKAHVTAGGGNDTINASGSDVLVSLDGGAGSDVLIGGQADSGGTTVNVPNTPPYNRSYQLQNTLLGGSGNDVLIGGAGNDSMLGGSGNDTMSGEGGNDLLNGNSGNDKLSGGDGSDTVSGSAGNDSLTGDDGDDYVYGGTGKDTLSGGDGLDVVKGQEGLDHIEGTRDAAEFEVTTLNTNEPLAKGTRSLDSKDTSAEYAAFTFDLGFVPNADDYL